MGEFLHREIKFVGGRFHCKARHRHSEVIDDLVVDLVASRHDLVVSTVVGGIVKLYPDRGHVDQLLSERGVFDDHVEVFTIYSRLKSRRTALLYTLHSGFQWR